MFTAITKSTILIQLDSGGSDQYDMISQADLTQSLAFLLNDKKQLKYHLITISGLNATCSLFFFNKNRPPAHYKVLQFRQQDFRFSFKAAMSIVLRRKKQDDPSHFVRQTSSSGEFQTVSSLCEAFGDRLVTNSAVDMLLAAEM